MKPKIFVRGDTKVLSLKIKQGDSYLVLTGGTFYVTIKSNIKDADASAVVSKEAACTGTSCSINLSHNDTKNLLGDYVMDFKFVGANTTPVITAICDLKVIANVTQRVPV